MLTGEGKGIHYTRMIIDIYTGLTRGWFKGRQETGLKGEQGTDGIIGLARDW
jgi:hypothetical protein